jgi:hypothetical protein
MTEPATTNLSRYRPPKGPRPPRGDKPAHFRLSKDTWKLILKEYVDGATATELSAKWRVSVHAIRKQITTHQATKGEWGDRIAIAQAAERDNAMRAARENTPEARADRLFEDRPDEPEAFGDPEVLGRVAVLASGRAMTDQLWNEAKVLTALAEAYGRLTARRDQAMPTLDTLPLDLLVEIAVGPESGWIGRMNLITAKEDDPENRIRELFWERREAREQRRKVEHQTSYAAGVEYGRRNPQQT